MEALVAFFICAAFGFAVAGIFLQRRQLQKQRRWIRALAEDASATTKDLTRLVETVLEHHEALEQHAIILTKIADLEAARGALTKTERRIQ